jgi:hypothetical protein
MCYLILFYTIAEIGNYLENRIDPMVIIMNDIRLY